MKFLFKIVFILLFFFFVTKNNNGYTEDYNSNKYGNIKIKKVNVRIGPSLQYPIKYVYYQENLPVVILDQYENWLQIRDYNNDVGWVLEKFIDFGKKRYVLILKEMNLYTSPDKSSDVKAKLEKNVVARISRCEKKWCKIKVDRFSGWIFRYNIWGISDHEIGKF